MNNILIRDFNGGGHMEGAARGPGRYGGVPTGKQGKLLAGALGVGTGLTMYLELKDSEGSYHRISDLPIETNNGFFLLTPTLMDSIPVGGHIYMNIINQTAGVTGWFIMAS